MFEKFKRRRHKRWMKRTGKVYHNHCGDIVVSKQELLNQLKDNDDQYCLLKLLIYGKSLPDYNECLLRVCLKFDFLGSLVFPIDEENTDKPPVKIYVLELFQSFYETVEEVKEHVERIKGESVTDELAKVVFRKMVFIINTCCPLMAATEEIYHEGIYHCLVEYAIEHEIFEFPDEDNIWKLFSGDKLMNGLVLDNLYKFLPGDLVEHIINEAWKGEVMRW